MTSSTESSGIGRGEAGLGVGLGAGLGAGLGVGLGAGRARRLWARCGHALARALLRALAWPLRVYEARRIMLQLGSLGDHELRDMGLTRLDLQDASALAFDADPSLALRRRVEERRRRR